MRLWHSRHARAGMIISLMGLVEICGAVPLPAPTEDIPAGDFLSVPNGGIRRW